MPIKLPQISTRVRITLQLVVSAALLAFLISQLDWERASALIRHADALLLAGVFAIQSADRVLMALKWHQLLRVLDGRLTRSDAIRVYYESTFIGFVLPLGGLGPDLVRFMRVRGRGVDAHVTLSSIIMERLNGVIATLVLVVLGLAVLAQLAPQPALRAFALTAALGAGLGAALGAALIFHRAFGRTFLRLMPLRAGLESGRFAKYMDAARAYSTRRTTLVTNLALSILEQAAPVFSLWVVSYAVGAPVQLLTCLAVAPVAVIIQRLPLTYAGLGLREGSAAALLVALGYDYSTALVLLMTQFVVFLITLLPGAIILATAGRRSLR